MLRLYISGLIQIPIVTHRRSACGDDAIAFRDSLHANYGPHFRTDIIGGISLPWNFS